MRRLPFLPLSESSAYCWVIIFACMLGLFASLGLGRFSLGMMLPAMGQGLDLSYAEMGIISTANFCGYLAAVLLCGRLTGLWGARRLIFLALLLVGGSMLLVGGMSRHLPILLLYSLTGVGSALSNVPIMALISAWFSPSRRGRAAGLCVMGNGLGLLVSGKLVPLLNMTAAGWRMSWLVLGGMVLAIAVVCLLLLRDSPAAGAPMAAAAATSRGTGTLGLWDRALRRRIAACGAIYFLFGFSYVIYITFLVTSLVQDRGLSEAEAGGLWSWVGVLSLGSGPLFGWLSDRFGRRSTLMLVFAIQTAAYLLVAMKLPLAAVYLSIACFGLVAWSVPSIMAALTGDYAGSGGAAAAFGYVTFAFGIGQVTGPALAGILAETTGGFGASFGLAAVFTLAAILLSSRLPAPDAA